MFISLAAVICEGNGQEIWCTQQGRLITNTLVWLSH